MCLLKGASDTHAFNVQTQKNSNIKEAFPVAVSPARSGGQDKGCEGGDNISLMRLMGKSKANRMVKENNKTSGIKVLNGEKQNYKSPVLWRKIFISLVAPAGDSEFF